MKTLIFTLTSTLTALYGQTYYEARSLGVLPAYSASEAMAVNDYGVIVGYAFTIDSGGNRAFMFHPDSCQMHDLGTLGGANSKAFSVNAKGRIVGISSNKDNVDRAFAYSDGSMWDLAPEAPGSHNALHISDGYSSLGYESFLSGTDEARSYNFGKAYWLPKFAGPNGTVTVTRATATDHGTKLFGYVDLSGTSTWGVRLDYSTDGHWHRMHPVPVNSRIPMLEAVMRPIAANRQGIATGAAGYWPWHAFRTDTYDHFPAIDLGTLNSADPAVSSAGMAINDSNWVVGWSEKTPGGPHFAFLHDGSTMIDLNTRLQNPAGWELMSANGINTMAGLSVRAATTASRSHSLCCRWHSRVRPSISVRR